MLEAGLSPGSFPLQTQAACLSSGPRGGSACPRQREEGPRPLGLWRALGALPWGPAAGRLLSLDTCGVCAPWGSAQPAVQTHPEQHRVCTRELVTAAGSLALTAAQVLVL